MLVAVVCVRVVRVVASERRTHTPTAMPGAEVTRVRVGSPGTNTSAFGCIAIRPYLVPELADARPETVRTRDTHFKASKCDQYQPSRHRRLVQAPNHAVQSNDIPAELREYLRTPRSLSYAIGIHCRSVRSDAQRVLEIGLARMG